MRMRRSCTEVAYLVFRSSTSYKAVEVSTLCRRVHSIGGYGRERLEREDTRLVYKGSGDYSGERRSLTKVESAHSIVDYKRLFSYWILHRRCSKDSKNTSLRNPVRSSPNLEEW